MRRPNHRAALQGRRVLITGAARGVGAALARCLHARGARVVLAGLEPEGLAAVARDCGDAPWRPCDVTDRERVERVVGELAGELGGLDVVVANAGVAGQWPVLGGDPRILETTMRVNVFGTYHTLRAAGPYICHPDGYVLAVASLAAAVHAPLLGAYSASKAAVEALGNTLRIELRHTGARVGVAYFAELDTDMTHRGFGTRATAALQGRGGGFTGVTPLRTGIDALERGIATRARRVHAPFWVGPVLHGRMAAQRVFDLAVRPRVERALRIAGEEDAPLTTPQPVDRDG
jgi:NAD(P)-dependent dehydrogenase (short-subunit alcohol dehydrogenase family)